MFGHPTPILRSFDERRAKRFCVEFQNARRGEPQLMDWASWEIGIHDPASNRLTFYTEANS